MAEGVRDRSKNCSLKADDRKRWERKAVDISEDEGIQLRSEEHQRGRQ